VADAVALVPNSRRRALTARRVQLGRRLSIVSEAELEQLRHRTSGDGGQCDAAWVLAAASSALCGDGLDGLEAQGLQVQEAAPVDEGIAASDLSVCGAVRAAAPTVLHSVAVSWPQAAAWRKDLLGLDTATFVVELGL
jgi:hypothetical protein